MQDKVCHGGHSTFDPTGDDRCGLTMFYAFIIAIFLSYAFTLDFTLYFQGGNSGRSDPIALTDLPTEF